MARDDYFIIAYRILAYLYVCLKEGVQPDISYISADSPAIGINESYWEYITINKNTKNNILRWMFFYCRQTALRAVKRTTEQTKQSCGSDPVKNVFERMVSL